MNRRMFGALASAAVLAACSPSTRKLDEATMYEGPVFRLKLVRYYQNLPFSYTGEVFRVLCASARTARSPAGEMQDAGWVTLGNGGAIGSKSATEVAQRERGRYVVVDDETLVWTGTVLSVSFDACGSFRRWDPTSLPRELIVPVEKPDYCAPKGQADCRYYDFQGEREPHYEDIRADRSGSVSFIVRSEAFRDRRAIRVRSSDSGRTWRVDG